MMAKELKCLKLLGGSARTKIHILNIIRDRPDLNQFIPAQCRNTSHIELKTLRKQKRFIFEQILARSKSFLRTNLNHFERLSLFGDDRVMPRSPI